MPPLPFSREAFLDVFAAYNQAVWPFALGLWLSSAAMLAALVARAPWRDVLAGWVLTLLWTWTAVTYHAIFFTAINPAAWLFAALFLTQGWLLVDAHALSGAMRFDLPRSGFGIAGIGLVAAGLGYPALTAIAESYPRMPTFGVPCPTALVTIGMLLLAPGAPRRLLIVPLAWAAIGGSAAFLLGMRVDSLLLVAAAAALARLTIDVRVVSH